MTLSVDLVAAVMAVLALVAAWSLFLAWCLRGRHWPTVRIFSAIVGIVALGVFPWVLTVWDDQGDRRRGQAAVQAFEELVGDREVVVVEAAVMAEVPVFVYLNGGQRHIAVQLAGEWLDVVLGPAEGEGG